MSDSIFGTQGEEQLANDINIFSNPGDTETGTSFPVTTTVDEGESGLESTPVYNPAELNDPNSINVSITNTTVPLVILFGPPSCGKTMTLVRLTRYLSRKGFDVQPKKNFRPAYDENYKQLCNGFNSLINSNDAAESTNRINFMLIEVLKGGKSICQLLESPGEFYFDKNNPNAPFPNFLNTIFSKDNRKIVAMMLEPDWLEDADRKNYVRKILDMKRKMRSRDRSIIVFNKIDKTPFVIAPGRINRRSALKEVRDLYPDLIESFKNLNPITSLWKPYEVDFVPFQTGDYSMTSSGRTTFQEGPDEYPRMLWEKILKGITG